jgi:tetratricopeptide (TPR) repeat protein
VVRLEPNSVRHHQKSVEYAFRGGDKSRLGEAYLALADALFRTGQTEKSRAVYNRVLELSPDDRRAQAALATLAAPAAPAPATRAPAAPGRPVSVAGPSLRGAGARAVPAVPEVRRAAEPRQAAGAGEGSFVNLGDWLRGEEPPKSTRMVIDEQAPTGDEQADFDEMLRKFKQGVAENVEEDDHESHYDLGVAYKEMGLLDEAIAEFQKALRAPGRRARTYEALGHCFLEKQQLQVALTILERALGEPNVGDDQLVGVLYLLGYASEALQRRDDALAYYHRVFAVDIRFRDVAERLNALEEAVR